MSTVFRPLLVVLILLSLLASFPASPAGASGRTQMTICGASGAETIWLDAFGNLTEAPTGCDDCPDCTIPAAADLPPPAVLPVIGLAARATPFIIPVDAPVATAGRVPMPRGPPLPQAEILFPARIAAGALEFGQGLRGSSVTCPAATREDAR